jgi:hypothetical protein
MMVFCTLIKRKTIQSGGRAMKGKYEIWLTLGISCLFVMSPCAGYGASLTIGNTVSVTGIDGASIEAGSPVYIDNSGQLGTVTSSGIITVNCSAIPPQSLQAAVNAAQPGDIIQVTGTCTENVLIQEEKQRLTLDGQNAATLQAATSNMIMLNVRGKGILIKNFTLTGGHGIHVERGSTAVIDHNEIHDTGDQNNNAAINVVQSSFAVIVNNNIHNNPWDGILVNETSTARIGFDRTYDSVPSPNTIQSNGGRGITVTQTAMAWIIGNTIAANTGDGIGVFRGSSANIASNTINGNGGDGVNVSHNSSIFLGEDSPVNFFDLPNITTTTNSRYGIECSGGGFVKAHLGSTNPINGTLGQTLINSSCPNSIVTP